MQPAYGTQENESEGFCFSPEGQAAQVFESISNFSEHEHVALLTHSASLAGFYIFPVAQPVVEQASVEHT